MLEETNVDQINFEKMLADHFVGELPEEFTKSVTYILQRNGIWEVRKTEVGLFARHLVEQNIPGLPNVVDDSLDELFVPKIPIGILGQAVSFFRHIYRKMKSESFLDVIYNPEEEKYYTYCPKQKVSQASVVWEIPEDEEMPKGIKVLELHSHCNMGSFFSGTDDADEKADQYYGVVGKLEDFMPKISFRLVLGGEEYKINVEDIFDLDGDVYHSKFPKEWADKVTKGKPMTIVPSSNGRSPSGLPSNLQGAFKEFDYNEDCGYDEYDIDDVLDLTADEFEIYNQYLRDYYEADNHINDEEGFVTANGITERNHHDKMYSKYIGMGGKI